MDTEVTRSYIIIPASARARLAQDIITDRSPRNFKYTIEVSIYITNTSINNYKTDKYK